MNPSRYRYFLSTIFYLFLTLSSSSSSSTTTITSSSSSSTSSLITSCTKLTSGEEPWNFDIPGSHLKSWLRSGVSIVNNNNKKKNKNNDNIESRLYDPWKDEFSDHFAGWNDQVFKTNTLFFYPILLSKDLFLSISILRWSLMRTERSWRRTGGWSPSPGLNSR